MSEGKLMGRIDGDGMPGRVFQTNEGIFTSANPDMAMEALNRECERLRGRAAELEAQLKTGRQCIAERDKIIERIEVEFERLREENERLRSIPISPGTVRELECLRIIIKHMAPLL